eukprot:4512671-Ditylum_brightwellii.AAC.1
MSRAVTSSSSSTDIQLDAKQRLDETSSYIAGLFSSAGTSIDKTAPPWVPLEIGRRSRKECLTSLRCLIFLTIVAIS